MAGAVTAQGLERRESPVTRLALVHVRPSGGLVVIGEESPAVELVGLLLLMWRRRWARGRGSAALGQQDEALRHVLLVLRAAHRGLVLR